MRYPQGHKEAVRGRIVAAAAALRKSGLSGVSIPALMQSVGLTHGGFYAHFESREELVAQAIQAAAQQTATEAFAEDCSLEEMLSSYLSPEHAEHPEQGCVVASLGPEGLRQSAPVRRAFAAVTHGFLRLVHQKLHPKKRGTLSDDSLRLASTMVGAVILARLVDNEALASRILSAAREASTT